MKNFILDNFQAHPFHLVSQSPWPIFASFSLIAATTFGILFKPQFLSLKTFKFVLTKLTRHILLKPHSFVSLPVQSFSILPVFIKFFGHVKQNWHIIVSVMFIIYAIRTIPVIMCKDIFKAYDLAHLIVVIHGFTHAIICLFKRCYTADYSYNNKDFLFDLAIGLIIGRFVLLLSINFGLIGFMCLTLLSMLPSVLSYFITLLEELSPIKVKPEYCMAGDLPYEHTPWSQTRTGHLRINPRITEAQWRSYAEGKMPCLWHMVSIAADTRTLNLFGPGTDVMEARAIWRDFMGDWSIQSARINDQKLLYSWFLDRMPTDGSRLIFIKAFFDINTTMPTENKHKILLVLQHMNADNKYHTTLNYHSRPFQECYLTNTTIADLKIYANVKSEGLNVLSQQHRALFQRTWDRAKSTGVDFDPQN